MVVVSIEGGLGSGKTIMMVRYGKIDHDNGFKIYSNFGLKNIEYEPLDLMLLLEMDKDKVDLQDCDILIDEVTVFADCRKSGSKLNRMISYLILQSRKRSVNIYFTTQSLTMVDLRLMNYTDIQILAEKIYNNDVEIDGIRHYYLWDVRDIRNIKTQDFYLDISKYYEFYDTDEKILPPTL